jgi:hypothetical protein
MNYLLPVRALIFLFLLVTTIVFGSFTQSQVVSLIKQSSIELKAGETVIIPIKFFIKEGYHIQADTVKDDNLIPTSLTFKQIEDFEIKIQFPEYNEFLLTGTDETLLVFDNEMSVIVEVSAMNSLKQGAYNLTCELNYQACNSVRCLFPRKLEFEIDVNLSAN